MTPNMSSKATGAVDNTHASGDDPKKDNKDEPKDT